MQSLLDNVYGELGYKQNKPTLIWGDNDGPIAIVKNPQFCWSEVHLVAQHNSSKQTVTLQLHKPCDWWYVHRHELTLFVDQRSRDALGAGTPWTINVVMLLMWTDYFTVVSYLETNNIIRLSLCALNTHSSCDVQSELSHAISNIFIHMLFYLQCT